MLLKRFLFFVILLSVAFQSIGQTIKGSFDIDSSLDSMLSIYAKEIENCEVDELEISSLGDLKNICESLLDSGICDSVEPEYRINCDNLIENDAEYYTPKMETSELTGEEWAKACGSGIFKGSSNIGYASMMIPGMIIAGVSFAADAIKETGPTTAVVDYTKSSWNTVAAEADRLESAEEEVVFEPFLDAAIINPHLEEEGTYGCLNRKGQLRFDCAMYTEYTESFLLSMLGTKVIGATAGGAIGGGALGGAIGSAGGPIGASVGVVVGVGAGIAASVGLRLLVKAGVRAVTKKAVKGTTTRAGRRAANKRVKDKAKADAQKAKDKAKEDKVAAKKKAEADKVAAKRKAEADKAAAKRKAEADKKRAEAKAQRDKLQAQQVRENARTERLQIRENARTERVRAFTNRSAETPPAAKPPAAKPAAKKPPAKPSTSRTGNQTASKGKGKAGQQASKPPAKKPTTKTETPSNATSQGSGGRTGGRSAAAKKPTTKGDTN